MTALSPAAMPDRNTLRALAQAAARGEAPFQSCIVSVGAHTRVRNGKQESVSAYTRANPDCGEESDGSWIAVQDRGSVCTAPGSLDTGLHYAARLRLVSSQAARASSGLRWPFFSISHSAL